MSLTEAIKRRWCSPEWLLFWEVGNSTGSRCRRHADAVALSIYPSRGLQICGIEIKSSRSDWLRELKQPEKSVAVQQYCDCWWLVAESEKIVDVYEVPPNWGLIVLKDRRLCTVKNAPALTPKPVDRGFVCALFRHVTDHMIERDSIAEEIEAAKKDAESAADTRWKYKLSQADKDVLLWQRLKSACGMWLYEDNIDEIGQKIKWIQEANLHHLRMRADALKGIAEGLLRSASALEAAATEGEKKEAKG